MSQTILLVEDNPDDVFAMRRALKLSGVTNPLNVVIDGQQALDYLSGAGQYADRGQYPLPFIIFLDLKLPDVEGFEILAWLRAQPLQEAAVVVLTSSAESRDFDNAYGLGARSYLTKPPSAQMLLEVFESLKSYWLTKTGCDPVAYGPTPPQPSAKPTTTPFRALK